MTDRPVEPPVTDELPEMIQRASEVDDPNVFRLCDVIIRHRRRIAEPQRANILDDGDMLGGAWSFTDPAA